MLAGLFALALYWRALLAAKGSRPHRRWGRIYLLMLLPLLASVVPVSLHLGQGNPARMAQIVYLSLVLGTAGWTAWRAVRDRGAPERFRGPAFRALAVAMAACGSGLMVIEIVKGDQLAVGFAVIGIVYGGAMLGELGRPPAPDWSSWHLNGVSLLFAATHAIHRAAGAQLRARPRGRGDACADPTRHNRVRLWPRQWLGHRFGYLADGDRAGLVPHGAARHVAHPSSSLARAQSSG